MTAKIIDFEEARQAREARRRTADPFTLWVLACAELFSAFWRI